MTNAEKYKTAEERTKAFDAYCAPKGTCADCPLGWDNNNRRCNCVFLWLDMEAKE